MIKDGYIDLTMYEPFNKFQQVSSRATYNLIKKGKVAKKALDWEDEDEDGINIHIESLERELNEWKQMKENLNKNKE